VWSMLVLACGIGVGRIIDDRYPSTSIKLTAAEQAAIDRTVASAVHLTVKHQQVVTSLQNDGMTATLVQLDATDIDGPVVLVLPVVTCDGETHVSDSAVALQDGTCEW